ARQFRLSERLQHSPCHRFRCREENLTAYQGDCFSLYFPCWCLAACLYVACLRADTRRQARRQLRGNVRSIDVLVALFFEKFDGKFLNGGFGYFCHF
ncbi:MAG: hypothetical protein KAR54_02675, partial [Candidatus Pacebacteria bacterium]|nr:hypothetical protein [Candidatus Paceibacterota bacterium]